MVTRLTRMQRQEQTRAQLLDAALRVFLRRGFHGASLDEIAEEAGYTTGAVYSNFKGKDDLFLAVLDAEAQRRFPLHSALMLDAPSIEEGLRASAREMAQYARAHPGWTGVYVEFWTHASRRTELRARVAEQHERLLDTVGGLVAEWAGRWGVEFKLPAREVVRGTYAISRGLGLEALLADEPGAVDQLEEMFLAYAMGLIRARPGAGEGGSHDHDHPDHDQLERGGPPAGAGR
jgi:AcrR family transcriptional regulator